MREAVAWISKAKATAKDGRLCVGQTCGRPMPLVRPPLCARWSKVEPGGGVRYGSGTAWGDRGDPTGRHEVDVNTWRVWGGAASACVSANAAGRSTCRFTCRQRWTRDGG